MPGSTSTLAILFADLTGSTRLFEQYGNVQALKIVAHAIDVLTEVTEEYGGRVIKTIGDEIMCTFDQSVTAMQVAGRMQECIQADTYLATYNTALKVGFHFGETLLENQDVFGDAVNVAARMVSMAKAHQIITTEATLNQLPGMYRLYTRKLGKVRVRGKQEEVGIVEVIWQHDTSELTELSPDTQAAFLNESGEKLRLIHDSGSILLEQNIPPFSIGRAIENDLMLPFSNVSRRHAQIEFLNGKFILTDQSANGTYVRNQEQGPALMVHRESIPLQGEGLISFGQSLETNPQAVLQYTLVS